MSAIDPSAELALVRERRRLRRSRKRWRRSRLAIWRAELVALYREGASYREMAEWLATRPRYARRVDHSTVRRYLLSLPEIEADDA